MTIGDYSINGQVAIILMTIGGYYINGYQWLLY